MKSVSNHWIFSVLGNRTNTSQQAVNCLKISLALQMGCFSFSSNLRVDSDILVWHFHVHPVPLWVNQQFT